MPEPEFVPRGGAMRFMGSDGDWVCANPGDALYSTVSMAASEYWTDASGGWRPIWSGDGEGEPESPTLGAG